MKKPLLLIAFVSLITKFTFGQPSYSKTSSQMNPYKHPLKTATNDIALSSGKPIRFKAVPVKSDAGFKHPFNKEIVTMQYLVPTKKSAKTKNGSKHPLGM